ncbi:M48 family metallopeptidase, partial [Patescibacteria group bacterium]|nr:M48 family metallopeptidase [Patescibacteria group bacterium]MBU2264220.1 M48 family metallopeptidase [Patescibacteria group bacterium]
MKRKIFLHNQEIEYRLRKSKRAKRMRIAVYCDTSVVVTLPYGIKENIVEKYLSAKAVWLLDKILYFKKYGKLVFAKGNKREYLKNKEAAMKLAEEKVNYFNKIYKLKFNAITIKRQKTRWGSCSKKGNLNYNYKMLFLPEAIADYIIVHELCHLQEFNHSRKFWNLVAMTIPNYLDIKKELK